MNSKMTIGKKLTFSFSAFLVLTFALGFASLSVIQSLGSDLNRAVNSTGKGVEKIGTLTTALSGMKAAEAGFILFSSLNDADQTKKAQEAFEQSSNRLDGAIHDVRSVIAAGAGASALSAIDSGRITLVDYFQQMVRLCVDQKCNEGLTLHTQKALPLIEDMAQSAVKLSGIERGALAEAARDAAQKSTFSYWIASILIVISVTLGVVVLFVVRDIDTRLRRFSARLAETSSQMSGAAVQVSTSSEQLASGASEQAAVLQETAATTEQLAGITRKNAENTRSAVDLVSRGDARVAEANSTLTEMVSSMSQITSSSNKISKIIKVIEEIAFQTNILALNAAVEAARAGESGLGFAVVADEVRNLAQRCSQAARDTASLIEESIVRSGEGSGNLDRVASAIAGITDTSQKIKALIDEVNVDSQQQARDIEVVSRSIGEMSRVTQETAANSQEGASAGKQIRSQSEAMNCMVQELREMVGQHD